VTREKQKYKSINNQDKRRTNGTGGTYGRLKNTETKRNLERFYYRSFRIARDFINKTRKLAIL
jgi:hypothetical protein